MSAIFPLPITGSPNLFTEIAVDLFAGGGGASLGYEMATGQPVTIAINHDAKAVSMHAANHPGTEHYKADVFEVNPRIATGGRPVGFLWASPDCTFHSKARGGKPIRHAFKKRRALAWVLRWWAATVRPRVICMENVEEFVKWGPMVGLRDSLTACKKRVGKTFRKFIQIMRGLGYKAEWRELRACDYGAPTIRKRWFAVMRCDGEPIVWPEPTHGDPKSFLVRSGLLKPWRAAAECIDWDLPMCSVFATKAEAKTWAAEHGNHCPVRPLAQATMGRLARGLKVHVLDSATPFLVPVTHSGSRRTPSVAEPMPTITCAHRGEVAIAAPSFVSTAHGETSATSKRWGLGHRSIELPINSITGSSDTAITASWFVPRYGERQGQQPRSRDVLKPFPTIVCDANGGQLASVWFSTYYGSNGNLARIASMVEPLRTQGTENRFGVTTAHLTAYYGNDQYGWLHLPSPTITTKDRLGISAHFLTTNVGGFAADNSGIGRSMFDPTATITGKGAQHSLTSVFFDQANGGYDFRVGRTVKDPISTITCNGRGHQALFGVWMDQANFGQVPFTSVEKPLRTIVAVGGHHQLGAVFFHHNNSGHTPCYSAWDPAHAIVADGARHNLSAVYIGRDFGQSVGSSLWNPSPTITATGNGKASLIAEVLARRPWAPKPRPSSRAQAVSELLEKYFPGSTRGEFVYKVINWVRYVVSDIRMRMLTPRELFRCQGFPDTYIIDRGADGKPLTATQQVHMCGNSVSPLPAMALISANAQHMVVRAVGEINSALTTAYSYQVGRLAS